MAAQSRARPPHGAAATIDSPAGPHLLVQLLGLLLFGGFAIVATSIAFVQFWPAGFALAVILAWIGFARILRPGATPRRPVLLAGVDPEVADPPSVQTGNARFDAYRTEVLDRLEHERTAFASFLGRLRDAKDKTEFERFMDARATTLHETTGRETTGRETIGRETTRRETDTGTPAAAG